MSYSMSGKQVIASQNVLEQLATRSGGEVAQVED